jgi:tetratricopeptide (TPR) repeat protein
VTLLLMRAEVALAQKPPDTRAAARRLQAVEPLVSKRDGEERELQAEFHYRSLELARLENDTERLRSHGEWFVEQGRGTRFELPGLVAVARQTDLSWEDAAAEQRPRVAERGLLIYQRLAERLGDSRQQLAGDRNAQVASSKVAYYAEQLGQFEIAQQALRRLLDAFPKDKGYLRRAGLIAIELRQFERSLEHWRTLLAGLSPGTDSWYEAKYYQLVSLREVDRPAAERVLRQFRLLDPERGSTPWRERFSELEREFGIASP